ncbi:MAG: amidase [Propionibacteriales bacterium]|nr:amidase [Propionibacteriales bacterium]
MPQGRQGQPLRQVHAFGDDALGEHDAVALAAAIRRGDISAVDAAQAAVDRAACVEPHLDAIVVADVERALTLAAGPLTGRLAGVPTYVKDNTDVAGLATRQGSRAMPDVPAPADAPFTTQLRATGLVPLGKSSLPEFGWNASTEFDQGDPTRNPWDTAFSSGASSGGAAALVASGVVPIAHANDGGGSIRIPAAACGLVGLKPTRGRLEPDAHAAQLPVDVVCNGVVTRTVRDTAHFLAAAEAHRTAPGLPPVGLVEGPSPRRLRVGLVLDSLTDTPTDADTRAAVLATVELLTSLGHDVVEVPLPADDTFVDAFTHYWAMLAFSTQHFGRRVMHPQFDTTATDPLTRFLAARFARSFWRLPRTVRALRRSEHVVRTHFAEHRLDVALSPTVAHTTPRLGHLSPNQPFPEMFDRLVRYAAFTPLNNATGTPAVSLPLGRTGDGLPIGVQLQALHGQERPLLELSYELEAAQPFARIQDGVAPLT